MHRIVFTIRLKLILAFGILTTLIFAVGLLALGSFFWLETNSAPSYRTVSMGVAALASMGCVIATYCGIHLHGVVCGGLSRVITKVEEIASTLDLSKRSSSPRMDEFGRAATAFDKLMSRLGEIVSSVQTSTDSLTISTQEIAEGNLDLSARTEEQAASLERTASSMKQLTGTVKRNADNARHASGLATNAAEIAGSGGDVVQTMVDAIERINGSSNKISEITGVIEAIAFQTNILALNAAVEAARAGEQGRGFAIVANEVRSLAQRSASAAKEIKDLIGSSVTTIQDGSQKAIEVSAAMSGITGAITQVSDIVKEIAVASEEQSHDIEQVNHAVSQMDRVTQRNAALVEQVAAAAQSLEDQATTLKNTVSAFRLAEASTTTAS